MKLLFTGYSKAYLLPATMFLSLAIATVSSAFLLHTVSSSETLNTQNYNAMAEEAARSGIAYADSCLSQERSWGALLLKPNTSCDGTTNAAGVGSEYVTVHNNEWRSKFSVTHNVSLGKVNSTGIVEILNQGQVVATYKKVLTMSVGEAYDTYATSTGQSLTDIKNDGTNCAVANGSLYCWGSNGNGQVGDGTATNRAVPTRVQGAIAGKTITKVSVSDSSVCVVADGRPYCWGGNGNNQLGNDIDGNGWAKYDVRTPSEDVPLSSSGPLDGQYVTDIGTASMNNPANLIWPFATAFQHSCALTADGAVSCWGYGGFRQNTGGGQREACLFGLCIPVLGFWSYPSHDNPTMVKGYRDNTGPFDGKKAVRVGASSHDSCLVANGTMYCWGVPAPLYAGLQISCSLPLGMFSDADLTIIPFNPCVSQFSNGYDATNAPFSEMSGKYLDPATWDVSANEGCMMADKNFYCFGTTPAFGLFWTSSFRAPWVALGDSDVTSADNGDHGATGGLVGLYCVVDRGVPKCAGSALNGWTGTGVLGHQTLRDVINTNMRNQVATKIAAGTDHGCLIANGRLYCWGTSDDGRLANAYATGSVGLPIHTGTTGATPIGTGVGQYAAHDSVSTGDGHSCAVANGKVFCWGQNNYGQLGMGNYEPTFIQPRSVPGLVDKAATKVSVGKSHSCAIVEGSLYCWGRNNNGQVGIGTTGTTEATPRLINGNGALTTSMRVTDVSAGDESTCAVANGRTLCWGNNTNKQLGDGTLTARSSPVFATGASNVLNGKAVTAVSVGASHACAIANADLYCWGNNTNGRTGLGASNTTGNSDPTLVSQGAANNPRGPNNMLPSVSAVAAGSNFTCAIFNAVPACWGSNANGRTGRTVTTGDTPVPTALAGAAAGYFATSITAGNGHACALLHGNSSKTNGNMYCWGTGAAGQLGYGTTVDRTSVGTAITGGSDMRESGELRSATSISAGAATSCAIANAVILCWGDGSTNQLGVGDSSITSSTTPIKTAPYQVRSSAYARGPVY